MVKRLRRCLSRQNHEFDSRWRYQFGTRQLLLQLRRSLGASFFCLGKEGHDAGKRVGTGLCSPFHPALADFLGSLLTGLIPVNVQHLLMGTLTDEEKTVLTVIRLPRFCYGALIGSALAASGAALQGVFGNPLADPGLLGISSGASLGAVLVLILNLAVLSPLMARWGLLWAQP